MPGVVEDAARRAARQRIVRESGALSSSMASTSPIRFPASFRRFSRWKASVRVDLSSGRYSPEFGKGSAGVLAINTENGTDAFHYTATDFFPGLSSSKVCTSGTGIRGWGSPGPSCADGLGSPIRSIRNTAKSLVTGLPSGQNTRSGWAGSNLLHTQVNLTPSNILFADFLVNVDNEGRVGLGPLNPVSTTSSLHTREYFASIKDQKYFGHGVLVEFGYAHNDFSDAQSPQGQNLYVISPQGNSGNYFLNSTQAAARDQGLIHAYLPKFQFCGIASDRGGRRCRLAALQRRLSPHRL